MGTNEMYLQTSNETEGSGPGRRVGKALTVIFLQLRLAEFNSLRFSGLAP